MPKYLKKILISGTSLLMLTSVGVGINNVSVNAKRHVRTHLKSHSRRHARGYFKFNKYDLKKSTFKHGQKIGESNVNVPRNFKGIKSLGERFNNNETFAFGVLSGQEKECNDVTNGDFFKIDLGFIKFAKNYHNRQFRKGYEDICNSKYAEDESPVSYSKRTWNLITHNKPASHNKQYLAGWNLAKNSGVARLFSE